MVAITIYVRVIYGCSHALMAELNSCDSDRVAHKA